MASSAVKNVCVFSWKWVTSSAVKYVHLQPEIGDIFCGETSDIFCWNVWHLLLERGIFCGEVE